MNTPVLVDHNIDNDHESMLNGDCSGAARAVPLSPSRAQTLSRQLDALAQPERVQLLSIIRDTAVDDPTCLCQLRRLLGLGEAELDAHLTAMRAAGLIRAHRRGAWTYYSAQPDCCADLDLALAGACAALPGADVTS